MVAGFYHKFNILKYRLLFTLMQSDEPLTTLDISQRIGISRKSVTDALSHYHRHGYGYTKRLSVKKGKFHLYIITKRGVESYISYDKLFRAGKSLNRLKLKSEKMASVTDYFGISKSGEALGLTKNDIPKLVGLKKRILDSDEHSK